MRFQGKFSNIVLSFLKFRFGTLVFRNLPMRLKWICPKTEMSLFPHIISNVVKQNTIVF